MEEQNCLDDLTLPSEEQKCTNCGHPLAEGQTFCPNCGQKVSPPKDKPDAIEQNCPSCGASMLPNQRFCAKCGTERALPQASGKKNPEKKLLPLLIVFGILFVAMIVCGAVFLPVLLKTPEQYMAEGKYEDAYKKAKKEEQYDVAIENVVAYLAAQCVDMLKDSRSFELVDAWCVTPTGEYAVLKVAANNSYGNSVINYWLFSYDEDEYEWKLWDAYADLNEEEYKDYDSSDEFWEKLFNNLGRSHIKETMNNQTKVSKDSVKRINNLFSKDLLEKVTLLDLSDFDLN